MGRVEDLELQLKEALDAMDLVERRLTEITTPKLVASMWQGVNENIGDYQREFYTPEEAAKECPNALEFLRRDRFKNYDGTEFVKIQFEKKKPGKK